MPLSNSGLSEEHSSSVEVTLADKIDERFQKVDLSPSPNSNDSQKEANGSSMEEQGGLAVTTKLDPKILYSDPNYAEICSYLNFATVLLGIKPISFSKLDQIFCTIFDGEEVHKELADFHIALMRKIFLKTARLENWESSLLKFCSSLPDLDKVYLKFRRTNYFRLSSSHKLLILKYLCIAQFDFNSKFRENLSNTYSTNEIRVAPIGTDRAGDLYYYQQDCDLNIRIWYSKPVESSKQVWELKAKSEEELASLISSLKDSLNQNDSSGNSKNGDKKSHQFSQEKFDQNFKINKATGDSQEMPTQEEQEKISLENKHFVLWDRYRAETILNRKKITKENKKRERQTALIKKLHIQSSSTQACSQGESAQIRTYQPETVGSFDEEGDDEILPEDDLNEEHESSTSDEEFTVDESQPRPTVVPKRLCKRTKNKSARKKKSTKDWTQKSRRPLINAKPISFVEESTDDDDNNENEEIKEREIKKAPVKILCLSCKKSNRPNLLLLCDSCDDAWHTFCLNPALWFVPDGDWFCPICEHKALIKKLAFALIKLRSDVNLKKDEEAQKAAAVGRIKLELDNIAISLNKSQSLSESGWENAQISSNFDFESNDDGQRRSKKEVIRRVTQRTREQNRPKSLTLNGPSDLASDDNDEDYIYFGERRSKMRAMKRVMQSTKKKRNCLRREVIPEHEIKREKFDIAMSPEHQNDENQLTIISDSIDSENMSSDLSSRNSPPIISNQGEQNKQQQIPLPIIAAHIVARSKTLTSSSSSEMSTAKPSFANNTHGRLSAPFFANTPLNHHKTNKSNSRNSSRHPAKGTVKRCSPGVKMTNYSDFLYQRSRDRFVSRYSSVVEETNANLFSSSSSYSPLLQNFSPFVQRNISLLASSTPSPANDSSFSPSVFSATNKPTQILDMFKVFNTQ